MPGKTLRIVLVFLALVLLTVAAFEGRGLAQRVGWVEREPVLVFVIPDVGTARRVRGAIHEDRIVWQGEVGLALVGGRVIASDLEDAADVIEGAGWVEHPIHIVRLDDPETRGERAERKAADETRLARLRTLMHKPTLTRSEQLFVLMAMRDGVEF